MNKSIQDRRLDMIEITQEQLDKKKIEHRKTCFLCKRKLSVERFKLTMHESEKILGHVSAASYCSNCWKQKQHEMHSLACEMLHNLYNK